MGQDVRPETAVRLPPDQSLVANTARGVLPNNSASNAAHVANVRLKDGLHSHNIAIRVVRRLDDVAAVLRTVEELSQTRTVSLQVQCVVSEHLVKPYLLELSCRHD